MQKKKIKELYRSTFQFVFRIIVEGGVLKVDTVFIENLFLIQNALS